MYKIGAVADLIRQQADGDLKPKKRIKKLKPTEAADEPPKPLYVEYKPTEPVVSKRNETGDELPKTSDSQVTERKRKRKGQVRFLVEEDISDVEQSPTKQKKSSAKTTESVPKKLVQDTPERLARTIFVGNLPASTTPKALKRMFSKYGAVESFRFRSVTPARESCSKKVAAINRKLLNENKKTLNAYVVFKEAETVANALDANGNLIDGNHICVDKADRKAQADSKNSVFVGNLPLNVTDEDLWNCFEECGTVQSVRVVRDRNTGMGKGFGFVTFRGLDSVALALEMNGTEISERAIRVMPVEKRKAAKKKLGDRAGKQGMRKGKVKDEASETDFHGARAERLERKRKLKKIIKAKKQQRKTKVLFGLGAGKGKKKSKKSAGE